MAAEGNAGPSLGQRFTDLPAWGMTRTTLFAVDSQAQRQHELLRLPDGEWFVGRPVRALNHVLLLTNKYLIASRPDSNVTSRFAPLNRAWQVPLAADEPAPVSISVVELPDGWLVSMFHSDERELDGFEGLARQWQQVVHVDLAGRPTVVAERRDIRDFHISTGSSPVPIASWWVSPALYALAHAPDLLGYRVHAAAALRAVSACAAVPCARTGIGAGLARSQQGSCTCEIPAWRPRAGDCGW